MKLSWSEQRARHKIGRSGGVSSAACAPARVERQRRRMRTKYRKTDVINGEINLLGLTAREGGGLEV